MLPVCECSHVFLYLVVGYLSVYLCRTDIAVSEYLAERFHRNAIGKANRGRERVASQVENIIHLRIWKNIENKPVIGCELGIFLYSASVVGKQFGTKYCILSITKPLSASFPSGMR